MDRMSSSYRAESNVSSGVRMYAGDDILWIRFAGGKGAGDRGCFDIELNDLDKI